MVNGGGGDNGNDDLTVQVADDGVFPACVPGFQGDAAPMLLSFGFWLPCGNPGQAGGEYTYFRPFPPHRRFWPTP
jgi:hypothetical protein